MKKIFLLLLAILCAAAVVACKSSTEAPANQGIQGTNVDLRGLWVEDTTDELHHYVSSPLVTLTITSNAKGTVGTADYPGIGKSYPIELNVDHFAVGNRDTIYYELHWGPDKDFSLPTKTCSMYLPYPGIKTEGSDIILSGTFSYWVSLAGNYHDSPDAEIKFRKKK